MSVQERVREHGLLQALGFRSRFIGTLVLLEAGTIGLLGSSIGVGTAVALIKSTNLAIGVEGIQVGFRTPLSVMLTGIGTAVFASMLAAVIPAWRAARQSIVHSLRSVA
jgi:putative ABC transport system permease protein